MYGLYLLYLPPQPRAGYGARGIRGIHVLRVYTDVVYSSNIVVSPTYIITSSL